MKTHISFVILFFTIIFFQINCQEKKVEAWELRIDSQRTLGQALQEIKATLGNRFNRAIGFDRTTYFVTFYATEDEIPALFKDKEWFDKNKLTKDQECYPCKQKTN
jgi:hypothetical protein